MSCPEATEVTFVCDGHKVAVPCLLEAHHDGDHRGRVEHGMTLTWPRCAPITVIKIEGDFPRQESPAFNAACVVKVNLRAGVELSARLQRAVPPRRPTVSQEPFPIQDAGPHPKDTE